MFIKQQRPSTQQASRVGTIVEVQCNIASLTCAIFSVRQTVLTTSCGLCNGHNFGRNKCARMLCSILTDLLSLTIFECHGFRVARRSPSNELGHGRLNCNSTGPGSSVDFTVCLLLNPEQPELLSLQTPRNGGGQARKKTQCGFHGGGFRARAEAREAPVQPAHLGEAR